MITPYKRVLWTTSLAALSVGALIAQDMTGTWQGTITNPQGKQFRLVAKVSRDAEEKLAAAVINIDANPQPTPARNVVLQGRTFKFEVAAAGATYEGRLSDDNNTITGTLTQGQPIPLVFARATPDTAWVIPEPPPPPQIMAADADPSFEVATIKPAAPDRPGPSILVDRAGMFTTTKTPLKELVVFAYSIHPTQVENLPGWAETEQWDIVAKPDQPGVANETQLRSMLQKLLAERFSLKFHRENKELTALTLTVGKDGPKLSVNNSGGNLPGFGGRGPGAIGVQNSTMDQFAGFLQARIVDRPVVNKTELTGKYDFTLSWRPDQLGPNAPQLPPEVEARPDIYTAMQEQLGLKFQSEKVSVPVLVVENAAKPSEN